MRKKPFNVKKLDKVQVLEPASPEEAIQALLIFDALPGPGNAAGSTPTASRAGPHATGLEGALCRALYFLP
jgi:hypothetical protein